MASSSIDWVRLHLPGFKHVGKFILWGMGRVVFSLWLFVLYGCKMSLKCIVHVIELTEKGTNQLLTVYNQLPHMGIPVAQIIETTAVEVVGEVENVITNLVQFLEGKHCLVIGDTGTGKSTLAQWLAYQVGGSVTVYDPDAAPEEWQGLNVVGRCGNMQEIACGMQADLEDLENRVQLRGEKGDKALIGMDSVTIAEEFPLLADEIEIAADWLIKHARRGRKPKRFIIALSQDDSVKALGIDGEGRVRNNFRMVRLGKFAVAHAKAIKNKAISEWLKAGSYRCMVDDYPCQLPDLSQFKAVTAQLRLPGGEKPVTTASTGLQPVSPEVVKAAKACLEAGLSESRVIKEVLGYQGSQYQQGKILLQSIREKN